MLNKFTIYQTIVISICFGIIASIYAYINSHTIIKSQEKKLDIIKKIRLYVIRFTHYSISFYARFYPLLAEVFLFNDIIYLFFGVLMYIHWIFFSECVLSIQEKQMLNPNYIAGSDTKYEPFFMLLHNSQEFYDIIQYLAIIVGVIVILRVLYMIYYKKLFFSIK
jgi:hypothetical protein